MGFRRGLAFEVTSVQKYVDQDIAWIRHTSPEEAFKIRAKKIFMDSEVFVPRFAHKANCQKMTKPRNKPSKSLHKVSTKSKHVRNIVQVLKSSLELKI